MLFFGTHGNGTALGLGTVSFQWTRLALFQRELDLDDLVIIVINRWCPTHTLLSCWAGRFVRLPVDLEEAFVKSLLLLSLPFVIGPGWRNQIDPVRLPTLDKLLGFRIFGVGQVLFGQ